MGSLLESLPCPQSPWLAWMGVPLLLFQAIFLHPYFQLNYPRSTKIFRSAVIPICIYLGFATLTRRTILPLEKYLHFNFGFISMPTFHFVCLSIIFGLHQGPVFKSEVELFNEPTKAQNSEPKLEKTPATPQPDPKSLQKKSASKNHLRNRKSSRNHAPQSVDHHGVVAGDRGRCPAGATADQSAIDHLDRAKTSVVTAKPPSIGELTRWISALFMSPRGMMCTWAPPETVVPLQTFSSYQGFMMMLIIRTIVMHFWFQWVCGLGLQIVIGSKGDTNHFLFNTIGLPPFRILKLVSPFMLTAILGGGAYSGFALAGALFNLVEVATIEILRKILPDHSQFKPQPVDFSNYPPLFNSPWLRTSLTDFWGKGWQAVFRHHFLFCGAQPMWLIFSRFGPTIGKLAAVMGAMGLSAAMHEFCLVSISRYDPKFRSTRMFLGQGVGIVLEAIFKKVTGRKISGPLGWFWTYGFIILNGKPMVDAWVERDLGNGLVPFSEWGLVHCLVPFGPLITDDVYSYLISQVKFF